MELRYWLKMEIDGERVEGASIELELVPERCGKSLKIFENLCKSLISGTQFLEKNEKRTRSFMEFGSV